MCCKLILNNGLKYSLKFITLFSLLFVALAAKEPLDIDSKTKKNEKIKLQLQWENQFEFAGFYAAKEKGFYEEAGLDVEFIEFKPKMNIVDEVLKGNAEYGLTYSTLVADYMRGEPIVFVANFFKQSPLVLVTQPNIKTPADLKGKKIMGLLDSTHKQIILTMLDKFNIKENDFTNIPRRFNIESFISKKVDAVSVFTTNEIYTLNKLGIKYNVLDPAVFGTKFYDSNLFTTKSELQNHPKRVEKFREASIRGWAYALKHKEELVDIIMKKYNTQHKSKEALLFEANQIEYLMLTNVYPIGSIDLERVQMIADSFAQSLYMPKESKEKLESFVYKTKINTIELTTEQKKYLRHKKELKMCVDPNWMPLEKIEDGKHVGIASEFMQLISQKIQTPIRLIKTDTWTQSLHKAQKRECDILALAEKTPQRKKYFNFTTPYVTIPLVIATKIGIPFIDNLNSIKGKRLGIVKDYSKKELLKAKYPNINLVEVESIQQGLSLVQQEKIFGFLDNSIVINHEIQKNNIKDISITGQFPEIFYLSIASRNDEPVLNDILEKALLSIDSNTRNLFINKWNNVKYQLQTDYRMLAQILFFSIVLFSVILYWNLKLKEEIKNKNKAKKKLKESEEKFRTLFDIAPVLLNAFDKKGKVVLWNKECQRVFGWSYEEIKNSTEALKLFYPDPEVYEKVLESIKNNSYKDYIEWHPQTKAGKSLVTMWANIKLPNGDVVNIGYDITNQRHNEMLIKEKAQQLHIAKKQLEELNNSLEKRVADEIQKNTQQQLMMMHQSKLAQMGEMIENIAHQWRQPLAQINSFILLIDAALMKSNFQNATVENKLLEIESLTEYMSKTIDDFKNFFNPNKQKSSFKLYKAVQKSLDILKGSLFAHQIKVELDIDETLECVSYLDELQQVILALVNNAIDALNSMQIKSAVITITAKEEKDYLYIDILDNAGGIDNDIIDKIFEPYFTTKHKSQGTGLGLYMAKMIIENGLKGKLSVQNKAEGACFTIQIPKERA